MKEFNYVIQDELGIHARPAGLLVKTSGKFDSEIKVIVNGKEGDAKRLFSLMGLAVKQNDEITIQITGSDEQVAYDELHQFFQSNL